MLHTQSILLRALISYLLTATLGTWEGLLRLSLLGSETLGGTWLTVPADVCFPCGNKLYKCTARHLCSVTGLLLLHWWTSGVPSISTSRFILLSIGPN